MLEMRKSLQAPVRLNGSRYRHDDSLNHQRATTGVKEQAQSRKGNQDQRQLSARSAMKISLCATSAGSFSRQITMASTEPGPGAHCPQQKPGRSLVATVLPKLPAASYHRQRVGSSPTASRACTEALQVPPGRLAILARHAQSSSLTRDVESTFQRTQTSSNSANRLRRFHPLGLFNTAKRAIGKSLVL